MDADTPSADIFSARHGQIRARMSRSMPGVSALEFADMPALIGNQECPQCGSEIGNVAGSNEAVCANCGYKDPCCE